MPSPRASLVTIVVLGLAGALLQGCGPRDPRAAAVLALTGDPARGRELYAQACAGCHRDGWRLTFALYGQVGVVSAVIDGVPHSRMPSFAAWPDGRIADLTAYLRTRRD